MSNIAANAGEDESSPLKKKRREEEKGRKRRRRKGDERRREGAGPYMRAVTGELICCVTTEQMISDRVSLETFCHRPCPGPIGSPCACVRLARPSHHLP